MTEDFGLLQEPLLPRKKEEGNEVVVLVQELLFPREEERGMRW